MPHHPLQISRLREIGWSQWDPIGLKDVAQEADAAASEYDSYLLRVAGLLKQGRPESEAVEYLVAVVTKNMGMPTADLRAAESTVLAIKSYIESIT